MAAKDPKGGCQGEIGDEGQAGGGLFSQADERESHNRANHRAEEQAEQDGLPAEKGADGAHELDIPHAHGLARQNDLRADGLEVRHALRAELVAAHRKPGHTQPHRHVFVATVHHLDSARLKGDHIGRAIEQVLVGDLPALPLHPGFSEDNQRIGGQHDLLTAEKPFAQAQDAIDDAGAGDHAYQALLHPLAQRLGVLEARRQPRAEEAGGHPAKGNLVGNDEVLEIDEGGGHQARQETRVDQGQRQRLPARANPAAQEQQARQQLDYEIAGRNPRTAVPALGPQVNPGNQRDIQIPGNGVVTVRTMRGRVNDALAQGQTVDADVEEAADHRAEDEEDDAPEAERHGGPHSSIKQAPEHRCF